ncbi:hypothetical protein SAMN05880556_101418 [Azospirillum sp. RU38E]|nr:hypothetical protein SAMN05880556_101418 [Azospirillum sp. RU38E]SNS06056.1 hypothetical protein SAMN05880591_101418 [Azospirillum sp. RU37A]
MEWGAAHSIRAAPFFMPDSKAENLNFQFRNNDQFRTNYTLNPAPITVTLGAQALQQNPNQASATVCDAGRMARKRGL